MINNAKSHSQLTPELHLESTTARQNGDFAELKIRQNLFSTLTCGVLTSLIFNNRIKTIFFLSILLIITSCDSSPKIYVQENTIQVETNSYQDTFIGISNPNNLPEEYQIEYICEACKEAITIQYFSEAKVSNQTVGLFPVRFIAAKGAVEENYQATIKLKNQEGIELSSLSLTIEVKDSIKDKKTAIQGLIQ